MSWIPVSGRVTQVSGFDKSFRWFFYTPKSQWPRCDKYQMCRVWARSQGQDPGLIKWKDSSPQGQGAEKGGQAGIPGARWTALSSERPCMAWSGCSSKAEAPTLWAWEPSLPTPRQRHCVPLFAENCRDEICSEACLQSCHRAQLISQTLPSASRLTTLFILIFYANMILGKNDVKQKGRYLTAARTGYMQSAKSPERSYWTKHFYLGSPEA